MTRIDPFTSDNARVEILTGIEALKAIAKIEESGTFHLKKIYGPRGRLKYRQYFGMPGEWLAGFVTEYGFHIRGRRSRGRGGDVKPAARATAEAIKARRPDDPSPDQPDLLPEGFFPRGAA